MRRLLQAAALLAILILIATSPVLADGKKSKHTKVRAYGVGQAFCPARSLIVGNVAVRSGRCYRLSVLRDSRGAFLAFVDPTVRIPSGQFLRLDSPAGRLASARIVYLVPMQMTGQIILIPVNTIQLVRFREEDDEDEDEHVLSSRLIMILTSAPASNVTVTFIVRF